MNRVKEDNTFNNVINIGENVQNLDELNDNLHQGNIKANPKISDNSNSKSNDNTKKDNLNDKYHMFVDEV